MVPLDVSNFFLLHNLTKNKIDKSYGKIATNLGFHVSNNIFIILLLKEQRNPNIIW